MILESIGDKSFSNFKLESLKVFNLLINRLFLPICCNRALYHNIVMIMELTQFLKFIPLQQFCYLQRTQEKFILFSIDLILEFADEGDTFSHKKIINKLQVFLNIFEIVSQCLQHSSFLLIKIRQFLIDILQFDTASFFC